MRSTGLVVDVDGAIRSTSRSSIKSSRAFRARAFPRGYRLPPTRALAEELGTNRNTVVRAYADLETAGFVTSTVGRGTFVATAEAREAGASAHAERRRRAASRGRRWSPTPLADESLRRGDRYARAPAGRDVVNLTRMQPSADLLPDELFDAAPIT